MTCNFNNDECIIVSNIYRNEIAFHVLIRASERRQQIMQNDVSKINGTGFTRLWNLARDSVSEDIFWMKF